VRPVGLKAAAARPPASKAATVAVGGGSVTAAGARVPGWQCGPDQYCFEATAIMQRLRPRLSRIIASLNYLLLVILCAKAQQNKLENNGGHYRYANIRWRRLYGNTVEFTLLTSWRRDYSSTYWHGSGPDGYAITGISLHPNARPHDTAYQKCICTARFNPVETAFLFQLKATKACVLMQETRFH
jgi:hypothetical protein